VFLELQKTFSTEARKKGQQQQQPGSSKAKKARAANVVSSTALTPGTPFMHDVCVSCSYYICARLATRKWSQVSSVYCCDRFV
jgi:5'-3' exonuclease